ncbi:uncharacterized protein LOC130625195 [Hydractinia symbiolongicarpus]|uniref:uncharacterized protein LOC130625195 n=1 Tax=Hydractinia symbiolongicarpus TaxID=13093 RepID=UPI00254A3A4C|nr:uncharacterized protein LOC130625195 [Hydractinia symbiolongicarpus]
MGIPPTQMRMFEILLMSALFANFPILNINIFSILAMTTTKLEELLSYVAPVIMKSSMRREAITPSERLCVTLRYLVIGDAQSTIADSYRTGKTSKNELKSKWNFGNCLGAIDGKHVVMQAPARSGLYYYNYKKTLVL